MKNEVIRISTTSANTADAPAVVLRQTDTRRLVFRPVLVDNSKDPAACVRGEFVYQRKVQGDSWEDHNTLPLSKLKADEWVKLELKSAEVLHLFEELQKYYEVVGQNGLGRGTREWIVAPQSETLRALLKDEAGFAQSLEDEVLAQELLTALFGWIHENESAIVAARLSGVSIEQLQQFDAVLGLAHLQRFCEELDDNESNDDESFWQQFLKRNSWVIAQVYAIPLMIVDDQVYVGGKRIDNRSGNTADFLYANSLSGNVILVEIKTPAKEIVGSKYRNNVHNTSRDVAGGVLQVLNAQQSLIEEYRRLANDVLASPFALSPRGLLIVGSQVGLSGDELRSFELFRNNQRDVDIVTFDEVRLKVQTMVGLLLKVAK